MGAIAFDTLNFAKRLKEGGFTEPQAEALAKFIEENLATKRNIAELKRDIVDIQRDLKELEVALKRDIEELRVELKRDIKELEVTLMRDMKELEVTFKGNIEAINEKIRKQEHQAFMTELERSMTMKLGSIMVIGVIATAVLIKWL